MLGPYGMVGIQASLVMSSQNFGGITRLICTYGVPLQPSSGLSDG
jgi:hypothetical protein